MTESVFVVVRKLSMSLSTPIENLNKAQVSLQQQTGVKSIEYLESKHRMDVTYDASVINIAQILGMLEMTEVSVVKSRWQRYRIGYYRFVDKNIYDNARYNPVCCNKSPSIRRR